MDKISIRNAILNKYIEDNLDNSKKINYTELTENDGLTTVFYKDLKDTEINGYPIASDFVGPNGETYSVEDYKTLSDDVRKQCELRFYYLPYSHELYIGTTGSGKTTGCVEPQLRAISSQKNKPNLFLTDPKGELFDRNAKHLKDNGYELFVLNFKDLVRSDRWNPLLSLYDMHMKSIHLGKDCKMHSGSVKDGLTLMADEKDFDGVAYVEYDGRAFPTGEACDSYVQYQKDILDAQVDDLINQFANMMVVITKGSKDPAWEFGAQDLLKGIIICLLEEAADPNSGFTREMMTFRTLQMYYDALRKPILADDYDLDHHPLMKNKTRRPYLHIATALRNAPNTMKSYCGVFDGATRDWFQGHIFALTTGNTINLDSIGDKPFAIFLITRDYDKSDFLISGLFIDWVYKQMLERAEKNPDVKPRALHFLLDEFGNIPAIKDFENKISTARSRNIWFHLVLQSYSQLDANYDKTTAGIIKDNCSQIFLGSTNYDTKEIFSRACGQHTIPRPESKFDPSDHSIFQTALIPVSALNYIVPGKMYTLRDKLPVIESQYIRSYICATQGCFQNFHNARGLRDHTPLLVEPFSSPKYTLQKLIKKSNPYDF